jgi:hypothetical protein
VQVFSGSSHTDSSSCAQGALAHDVPGGAGASAAQRLPLDLVDEDLLLEQELEVEEEELWATPHGGGGAMRDAGLGLHGGGAGGGAAVAGGGEHAALITELFYLPSGGGGGGGGRGGGYAGGGMGAPNAAGAALRQHCTLPEGVEWLAEEEEVEAAGLTDGAQSDEQVSRQQIACL